MPSIRTHRRPRASAIAAAAGALLAVGLALLAAGGWSQPADAEEEVLGVKVIKHLAGTGDRGFSGDGGPAIEAQVSSPFDVAGDGNGNAYIADTFNNRIRKVDTDGTITTVAGTGDFGSDGDGGPAIDADLGFPLGVATDGEGNLYIADTFNHRIRKVDSSGTITTVAGTGTSGFNGDGQHATDAQLDTPWRVAVDDDDLYIADTSNHRIRKVDASGTITTVAGTGTSGFNGDDGDDQPATEAQLNAPRGLAVHGDHGRLYVADTGNERVRAVDALDGSGTITTLAGTGEGGFNGDGQPATDAQIDVPGAVAVDATGNVFIAEVEGDRVRKVDTEGIITTEAGTGSEDDPVLDGVIPTETSVSPSGLGVDKELGLLIADTPFQRVRHITRVPDLVGVAIADPKPDRARVGDEMSYTVKVTNNGLAGDASGVVFTDPLEQAELVSAEPSQGTCSTADGTLTCELGGLAEGVTATVEVTVLPTVAEILTNSMEVDADGEDPFPSNNATSVTTLVQDARCGEVLTDDTTLTDDVGPCPRNGLIVGADDITVDLNGHELIGWRGYEGFGLDEDLPESLQPVFEWMVTSREAGVLLADRHDTTVENGSVTGFSAGVVVVQGSSGNTVQNLTVHDNIGLHPFSLPMLGDGIFVFDSPDNVIADNTVSHNGYYDNIGVWGPDSDGNEVTGNVVQESPPTTIGSSIFGMGIIVNGADEAQGTITGMTIANNTVRHNRSHGISNTNGFDAKIVNNLVEDNGHRYSAMHSIGGRGIGVSTGRELRDADANVTVAGNTVRNNRRDGIHIQGRGNKIINNTSLDNAEFKDSKLAGEGLFDLTDRTSDTCEFNTWNNNEWGSAGYHPDCTSTTGLGPGQNPGAGAEPDKSEHAMPSRPTPSFDDIEQ